MTRTDAAGTYEVRDVPDGQSLGALADGYQPSALRDLDVVNNTGDFRTIDLVLSPGGVSLRGTVRDRFGNPIVGARVAVGEESGYMEMRANGTFQEFWAPRTALTDENGEYSFIALPAGTRAIQCRSHGFALWNGSTDLESGGGQIHNITLSKGCVVQGTVSDPEGHAVPNATVFAFFEALPEIFLHGGQVEYDGAFATPSAVTDETGGYTLDFVPARPMFLYALAPAVTDMPWLEIRLYTKSKVDLTNRAKYTWNAVVSKGLSIHGSASYSDGVPIEGFAILSGGPDVETRGAPIKDGAFEFIQLNDELYTVHIQMHVPVAGGEEPEVKDVRPGGGPIDLVAEFESPKKFAPARAQVRLVDAGNRRRGETRVFLKGLDSYQRIHGRRKDGLWSFAIEEPGRYRPVATADNRVIAIGEDFVVQAGDDLTLLDLVTPPGGSILLTILKPADPIPTNLEASLRLGEARNAMSESFPLDGVTELLIDNLQPGKGVLNFTAGNVQEQEVPFEVIAGVETRVTVTLVPAVVVPYHLEWPAEEHSGSLSMRFIDRSSGKVIEEYSYEDLSRFPNPIDWSIRMPIGDFRFEVTKGGKPFHAENFTVKSLDPGQAPKLTNKP